MTSAHGLDPMEDTNKETAKAIQEVAKTTSDAIRMAERFGGFLGRVFGPAIEDIGEIAHLKTQYWKLRNAARFQDAVEGLLQERDLHQIERISARIGIPIIEAAINEDDDNLQALWARLMTSALSKQLIRAKRSHVEILKTFEPEDAKTLSAISTMFLSSLLEDKKLFAVPSNLTELLRFWQTLRHLERTDVIQLAHEEKEDESGEIKLYLIETDDDGQKKQNGVAIHVVVRLTTFGFNFLAALDLIGNRLMSIDWDEYLFRPAPDPV